MDLIQKEGLYPKKLVQEVDNGCWVEHHLTRVAPRRQRAWKSLHQRAFHTNNIRAELTFHTNNIRAELTFLTNKIQAELTFHTNNIRVELTFHTNNIRAELTFYTNNIRAELTLKLFLLITFELN